MNGLVEGVLGEVARTFRAVGNVVIVDGKIEGKAEARGVCRLERSQCVLVSSLVCVERGGRILIVWLVLCKLGEIAVVIAPPSICSSALLTCV